MVAQLGQTVIADTESETDTEKENCPPACAGSSDSGNDRSSGCDAGRNGLNEKLRNGDGEGVPFFHSSRFSNVPPTVYFPFPPDKETAHWIGYWGRHLSTSDMKDIFPYQKVNHFPGNFQIGRKDHLWRNFSRFRAKYGNDVFNFLPETYVLPKDLRKLKFAMRKELSPCIYILKPVRFFIHG
ncbi:unnamed protein product, partial [Soboliphyme baturini]|uniref:HSF_DOMAIN domain-containing protein n=1 Tax=Soboliphyme baturini TaxID=241478 RepID=A0A183IKM0_9BILA